MGKKVLKKNKKSGDDEKKEVKYSSLMKKNKVLRPKVYITDTSKFKTLVQHLTASANGIGISSSSNSSNSSSSSMEYLSFDDASASASASASALVLDQPINYDEAIGISCYVDNEPLPNLDEYHDHTNYYSSSQYNIQHVHEEDYNSTVYGDDLQSLLLDDDYPNSFNFNFNVHDQLTVYDYELYSGLFF